ncbi:MAG: DmsC/YnfH family molybdoenzyme membrane anchor subunit [Albidovulum sp.]
MHPAPSVIIFTVLSGLGFGFLAFLSFGILQPYGMAAFLLWGLGYALSVIGLAASAFHLGQPTRALRAFTQWRTSWLSREAWASTVTLLMAAPLALGAIFGGALPPLFGILTGVMCLLTVFATSMIYTQIKAVPRWNHWTTAAQFLGFALTGGAILSGQNAAGALLCVLLAGVIWAAYRLGDGRFAARGATLKTATGLGGAGSVRQFAPAHTGSNYLLREMIHVVGRKHALRLRALSLICAALLPAVFLLFLPAGLLTTVIAVSIHLIGAFAARWLFFAEAEHVVGLYYGQRQVPESL